MVDEAVTLAPQPETTALTRRLWERPYDFEFFQAVRLLQRLAPDASPVGRFVAPDSEAARFAAHPSLAFPPSEIRSLTRRQDLPPVVEVNFMGLIGPLGLLPPYYTELVLERLRNRDTTLRDFLDLFHHRMISLFYRAWERYRFPVAWERGEPCAVSDHLLALIGLGTPGLQDRQAVGDETLLFYAGLLAQRPRSAMALRRLLMDYFDVPIEIEQFVGAWRRLGPDSECRLNESGSPSEQLGVGAVAGNEVWDQQSVVRIRIGPLSLAQYLDFLPDGTAWQPLRALCRFAGGDDLDFEVQLILRRSDAPLCELGAETERAPRLGWLTWARLQPLDRDPDETILKLYSVSEP